jgi:hypothetical protein
MINNAVNAEKQRFDVQFDKVVRNPTLFKNMEQGTLYYPQASTFPLVDFYYLDNQGKLIAIQATIAASHPKPFSTYEAFYTSLGISINETCLSLYYLILPRQHDNYVKDEYKDSNFFKKFKKDNKFIKNLKKNISFYVLIPPVDFSSTCSEEVG